MAHACPLGDAAMQPALLLEHLVWGGSPRTQTRLPYVHTEAYAGARRPDERTVANARGNIHKRNQTATEETW